MTKDDIKQLKQAVDALYKVETMEIMQEEIPTLEGRMMAEVMGVTGAIDKLNEYLSIVDLNELNNGE